jgi:hypothetical protein
LGSLQTIRKVAGVRKEHLARTKIQTGVSVVFVLTRAAQQPAVVGFQALSNRDSGQKPVYSAIFPANFRPNFTPGKLGLPWAGVHATPSFAVNYVWAIRELLE